MAKSFNDWLGRGRATGLCSEMFSDSASESHRNDKWQLWDNFFFAGKPCELALTSLCLVTHPVVSYISGWITLLLGVHRDIWRFQLTPALSSAVSGHLTLSWDCADPHCVDPLLTACHMAGDHPSLVMSYDILSSFSMQSPLVLQPVINVVQNTSSMCRHLCEPGHKNVYESLDLEGNLFTICHLPLTQFHCERCLCMICEP